MEKWYILLFLLCPLMHLLMMRGHKRNDNSCCSKKVTDHNHNSPARAVE